MGPLCKVCGKPVPKLTRAVSFGCSHDERRYDRLLQLKARPADLAEAIRLAGNGEVVRLKHDSWYGDGSAAPEGAITGLTIWQGEYAWGGHFHAQGCAAQFGWSMADQFPHHAMPEHRSAMAQRAAKEGTTHG